MNDNRAIVPIVERYTFVVRFDLTKIRDADTVEGVAWLESMTTIPILNLVFYGEAAKKWAIRLEGVAAAEDHTVEGKMATTWTRAWFDRPEAQDLWLHTNGKQDNFGRTLGDIRTSPAHLLGLANDLLQSPFGKPYSRGLDGVWYGT